MIRCSSFQVSLTLILTCWEHTHHTGHTDKCELLKGSESHCGNSNKACSSIPEIALINAKELISFYRYDVAGEMDANLADCNISGCCLINCSSQALLSALLSKILPLYIVTLTGRCTKVKSQQKISSKWEWILKLKFDSAAYLNSCSYFDIKKKIPIV